MWKAIITFVFWSAVLGFILEGKLEVLQALLHSSILASVCTFKHPYTPFSTPNDFLVITSQENTAVCRMHNHQCSISDMSTGSSWVILTPPSPLSMLLSCLECFQCCAALTQRASTSAWRHISNTAPVTYIWSSTMQSINTLLVFGLSSSRCHPW